MKLLERKLGSIVYVPYYGCKGTIIGNEHHGYVLLGWKNSDKPFFDAWTAKDNAPFIATYGKTVKNIGDYLYCYSVLERRECTLLSPPIEYPDQKCKDCNVSAPHIEPNQTDKTYLCNICDAVDKLDTVLSSLK